MKIGELARLARCTVPTVRYYEQQGLLAEPKRTGGNFRDYGPEHLERLQLIRNCRALDMSHAEIHTLINLAHQNADDCGAINAVFDQHIAHVQERMLELTALQKQLVALRKQCQSVRPVDGCGILQGLAAMESGARLDRHTHLG